MSVILQEEVKNTNHVKVVSTAKVASPAPKVEGGRKQCRRTSGSISWSEVRSTVFYVCYVQMLKIIAKNCAIQTVPSSSLAASPTTPSLAEIMQEEGRRQREGSS